MVKFNPKDDVLSIAVGITDPKDAKQYLKAYMKWIQSEIDKDPKRKGDNAEQIAKGNIGYFAGYYDNKVRVRVEKLYNCAHPIFGSIAEKGAPGPMEAFKMGLNLGKKSKIKW
jgi:hypothetical protein